MTKAIEAAARAIWAEMPVDRGIGPTTASEIFAQAAITAYLAAMKAEGFVMVPVEPTDVQAAQGQWAISDNLTVSVCLQNNGTARKVYRAMIAASTPHDDGGE